LPEAHACKELEERGWGKYKEEREKRIRPPKPTREPLIPVPSTAETPVKFKIINATKYLGGGLFSLGCIVIWLVLLEPYLMPNSISDPLTIWEIGILLAFFGLVTFFLGWTFSKVVSRYGFRYRDWRARRVAKIMGGMLILTFIVWLVPPIAVNVQLPSLSPKGVNISELEKDTFALINQERIRYGLSPVIWSEQIAEVARNHSEDMAVNNFFAHQNLQGKNVDDRLHEAGASFFSCGEILFMQNRIKSETIIFPIPYSFKDYKTQSELAKVAVDGWMASPGHKAIILTPGFSGAGIGICVDSDGTTYYFTGVFVG